MKIQLTELQEEVAKFCATLNDNGRDDKQEQIRSLQNMRVLVTMLEHQVMTTPGMVGQASNPSILVTTTRRRK